MTIGSALSRGAPVFPLRSERLDGTCAPREKPCRPPVGSRAEKSAGTGVRQARPSRAEEREGRMNEDRPAYFVGIDWGEGSSQVCVMDHAGRVLKERSVKHSG